MITLPTGSGKTWLIGLIAYYFATVKKEPLITVIEPNTEMVHQVEESFAELSPNIEVLTLKDFYEQHLLGGIILIDEFDDTLL